ncbi:spermidine synthase [Streptomyces sp. H27-D2]|uniref:spermine/spermidine synthase domain-containing protein n=1 Tax=Streptomyces sp. H27-D2 TaxID=3046304 RepID=UPI002DB63B7C|nr:spermidine synthase [Streptomyces sp. H27-D2]MEC4018693.1 spermidine synthase [Streptomyces sp. H27-D2]
MPPQHDIDIDAFHEAPVTLERREGPYGEVVLRRRSGGGGRGRDRDRGRNGARGGVYEIIANGCFLMDTSDGRSERLLVRAALDALPAGRVRPALLIGGLGVGFSLAEAAAEPRWGRITVVERERAVIDWHRRSPLDSVSGAALADPRGEVVHTDLVAYLRTGAAARRYDALCLDIDNGPDWTVADEHENLYGPTRLAACRECLTPGGVLALWSSRPSAAFEDALRNAGFRDVRTEEIQVVRGVPDVVHLAIRGA